MGHDAAKALINFFETLAYLHRKGAVSTESVWHYFGSWLLPYHEACRTYVGERQKVDPNCYNEFSALYSAVFQCEREKRDYVGTREVVAPTAITALLLDESKLPLKPLVIQPPA